MHKRPTRIDCPAVVRVVAFCALGALSLGVPSCGGESNRSASDTPKGGATAGGAVSAGGTTSGGTRTNPIGVGGDDPGVVVGGSAAMGEAGAAPGLGIPGTSTTSKTIDCGGETCKSASTLVPTLFVDPCCSAENTCGLKTDFLAALGSNASGSCEPKGQPGGVDAGCPTSAPQPVPINGMTFTVAGFVGCCRAETGTCGVVVDNVSVGLFPFSMPMLGCVDSAPFFGGEAPAPCGDVGSSGGAAGAPDQSPGGAAGQGMGGAQ